MHICVCTRAYVCVSTFICLSSSRIRAMKCGITCIIIEPLLFSTFEENYRHLKEKKAYAYFTPVDFSFTSIELQQSGGIFVENFDEQSDSMKHEGNILLIFYSTITFKKKWLAECVE